MPYGGLLATWGDGADQRGDRHFGSAGIAVALAMGAACVIAPGRNRTALDGLASRFGPWVRTVSLTGQQADARRRARTN